MTGKSPVFLTASALACLAAPLWAQDSLLSGELELTIARNTATPTFFKRVEASFVTQFGGRFDAQLDLGMSKYQATDTTTPFLGLHLIYAASPSTDLGLFLSGEDRLGTSYSIWGLEIAHDAGPLHIEAYAALNEPTTTGLKGEIYGLDLAYSFGDQDRWALLAGGHMADLTGSASDADAVYLGLQRRLRHDLTIQARAASQTDGDPVYSVTANISLGKGARFNRRDWFQAFPAN